MKVLHIIPSLSPSSGGPAMALPAMAAALVAVGLEVDVVATDDDGRGLHLPGITHGQWQTMPGGWRRMVFPKQSEFYKASLPLWLWLKTNARDYDGVHVHAVFSFASMAGCWTARAARVPYIVRPLGILNGWGMANRRRWVKGLSFRLLDKPLLDGAAAMHYTSGHEQREAESLGLRSRGVVLPLGFDVGAMAEAVSQASPAAFATAYPAARDGELVLFLSRLDPKKGLELLIAAFALLRQTLPEARLIIAGEGEASYVAALQAQATALGIAESVLWTGHIGGELKASALAAATLFVLPSSSENFGIALLEAMAAGLPCVASAEVALASDVAGEGAVKLAAREPGALAAALSELLSDASHRQRLGSTAQAIALRDYSLSTMGKRLASLYAEVFG